MTGLSPFAAGQDERRHGARSAHAVPPANARYLRAAILPVAVIAVACAAAAVAVLSSGAPAATVRLVLGAVTCGIAVMLVIVIVVTRATVRLVARQVRDARLAAQRGQAELQQMVDRLMRGEQPAPPVPVSVRAADGNPFTQLMNEIEQSHYHAGQAVLRVADKVVVGHADQRVEIFVNLARRMQSLVHREIELLDELEGKVEDPDLLKGLFTVDHLATRMRRQSESLAVLGGSVSRRQWTRQVTMHEVLRAAVAEVEQYSRVKVVPPVEGVLRGSSVTDVIHLIAELVENATKFSAPHTPALLRAQPVPAGIAIEIEDRGLGLLPADQQRMNDLLANPTRMDIDVLLSDGRIGLYVVATLARRHGIQVQLKNNIYGGTQAIVVLPMQLLEQPEHDRVMLRAGHDGDDASQRLALPPAGGRAPAVAGAPATAQASRIPIGASADASAPSGYGHDVGRPRQDRMPASAASAPRPPLPTRRMQASPAPQQPDSYRDEFRGASAARGTEPPADQMTGLMADFLSGTRRAEEEDSPARD